MIIKQTQVLFFLTLILIGASCKSTQNAASSKKELASRKQGDEAEYNAFFKAETARIKGQDTKARDLYRAFVKSYKTNDAAYYNLAKLEFRSYKFKDAENYAAKAVNLSPKNKYYLEFYADVLARNRKSNEAVEIYERLIALYPNAADTYRYKSYSIYSEQQDFNNAYKTLDKLEESWGVSSQITMQKVELLLKQKKEKQAIVEVQNLIKDEPQNPTHKDKLAQLYDRLGRKEDAKKIYDQLIDESPDDAKVLMRASSYYLRQNDTTGFQRIIKKIVGNPNIDQSVRMSMLMPLIELNAKDTNYLNREIIPLVRGLKQGNQNDKETAGMYADVLYGAKQYQLAAEAYRDYLSIDQSKYSAWFNLMLCHSNLDNLDSVITVANESLDYFPNNAFTHYFKGVAEYQKKDYQASVSSLQNAIDLEPERDLKAQIFSMMGDSYNSLKDYTNADKNFDKALEIKEDAGTLNNYAYYLSLRNDRLNKALAMSAKSLELSPGNKTFLDTYGWILYKQGDYKKALSYLVQAVEGAGDADVLEHLGDVHFKLKDAEKAVEFWKRAKNVGGGGSEFLEKKIRDSKLYE